MKFAVIFALAILLDFALGDPHNLPHPVSLIGRLISSLNASLFTNTHSFIRGLAVCSLTILVTITASCLAVYLSSRNILVQSIMLYYALAWRDLKDETLPVLECLLTHDIQGARRYLSLVVGRDTQGLNETSIIRAVIETISENSIDGIISVMFYAFIGWILGRDYGMCICVWTFKAANTLDSVLGYEHLHEFGKPSARLDDILGFVPARLGGLVIVFTGWLMGQHALDVFMAGRLSHKSPNSAHGESAFAGVLGLRLGGGASYKGIFTHRPFINPHAPEPEITDIIRAWRLLDASCAVFALMIICLNLLTGGGV